MGWYEAGLLRRVLEGFLAARARETRRESGFESAGAEVASHFAGAPRGPWNLSACAQSVPSSDVDFRRLLV